MKRLGVLAAVLLAGCSSSAAPSAAAPSATPPQQGVIVFSQASYSYSKDMGGVTSWTANLTEPAGALSLTVVLAKKAADGNESVANEGPMLLSNPDFNQLSSSGWHLGMMCYVSPPYGQAD
jgi:hypothetical protein